MGLRSWGSLAFEEAPLKLAVVHSHGSPCRLLRLAVPLAFVFATAHARAEDAMLPDAPPPPPPPEATPASTPAPAAAPEATPAPAPTPPPAVAQPAPVAPPVDEAIHPLQPEESPRRWYGWQTLATDGGALLLIGASISMAGGSGDSASATFGVGALGAYALGGPIVHFAHANVGRGLASLGIRVGAPVVLAYAGVLLENCGNGGGEFCGLGGAVLGFSAGIISAVVIDSAVLAFEGGSAESEASAPRFQLGFSPRGVVAAGTF